MGGRMRPAKCLFETPVLDFFAFDLITSYSSLCLSFSTRLRSEFRKTCCNVYGINKSTRKCYLTFATDTLQTHSQLSCEIEWLIKILMQIFWKQNSNISINRISWPKHKIGYILRHFFIFGQGNGEFEIAIYSFVNKLKCVNASLRSIRGHQSQTTIEIF